MNYTFSFDSFFSYDLKCILWFQESELAGVYENTFAYVMTEKLFLSV